MSLEDFLDRLRHATEKDIETALYRAHMMSPLILPAEMPQLFRHLPDTMTDNTKPLRRGRK